MTECIKLHREGEQEDAHEYLVNLLERLHRLDMEAYAKIWGLNKVWLAKNRHQELTSSIHQIFAGIIASQVKCTRCGSVSNSYDPFTDLSLELNDCFTVIRCLEHFTKLETLGNSNAYHCDKCNRKCEATKQLLIHTLPNILILQLKRFSFLGMHGGKLSKHIAFDMQLDMSAFLSRKALGGDGAAIFDLYGVLVHRGSSAHCGHYYSFVKHKDKWIKLDDSTCNPVSASEVLNQHAYILFYARRVPRQESLVAQHLCSTRLLSPVTSPSHRPHPSPSLRSPAAAHAFTLSPAAEASSKGARPTNSSATNSIGPSLPSPRWLAGTEASRAGAGGEGGGIIGPRLPPAASTAACAGGAEGSGAGELSGLRVYEEDGRNGTIGVTNGTDDDEQEAALERVFFAQQSGGGRSSGGAGEMGGAGEGSEKGGGGEKAANGVNGPIFFLPSPCPCPCPPPCAPMMEGMSAFEGIREGQRDGGGMQGESARARSLSRNRRVAATAVSHDRDRSSERTRRESDKGAVDKYRERGRERETESQRSSQSGYSRDRDRDRDRHRDRDGESHAERDRERDREREREMGKGREREVETNGTGGPSFALKGDSGAGSVLFPLRPPDQAG